MKESDVSVSKACEGFKLQAEEPMILVGIEGERSRLRVRILLEAEGSSFEMVTSNDNVDQWIEKADIVVGSGAIALEGVLHRKPVIVVGEYGFGGLLNPDNLIVHHRNNFQGRIGGRKDEYFPLDGLLKDIERGLSISFHELQFMSNQTNRILSHMNFDLID